MKFILSLDGGGMRGQFILNILQFIEHSEGKRIHEIFDMVVGVSAGGMVAAAVATGLRLDINFYNQHEVFRQKSSNRLGGLFDVMYSGQGKTSEIKRAFPSTLNDVLIPLGILTTKIGTSSVIPVTFTSDDKDAKSIPLYKVVDASSAAPVYFPPVKIQDSYYMDGGVVSLNPVLSAIEYTKKIWPDEKQIAILSIGTGVDTHINISPSNVRSYGLIKWLSSGLLSVMRNSLQVYHEPFIRTLIGEDNFMRIVSTQMLGKTDQTSISLTHEIQDIAGEFWSKHGTDILEFIHKKSRAL